jgi:hypothetical protein
MRREIEAALDSQRNIVPLMLAGFDFDKPTIASQLTGKLAALKKYNGLPIPAGYFSPAMERLRNKFLNVQVDAVLHPPSDSAQQVAKEQKDKAESEAKRRADELQRADDERKRQEAETKRREDEARSAPVRRSRQVIKALAGIGHLAASSAGLLLTQAGTDRRSFSGSSRRRRSWLVRYPSLLATSPRRMSLSARFVLQRWDDEAYGRISQDHSIECI